MTKLRPYASRLLFHLIAYCLLFTLKRFFELLKTGRTAEVDTMLQDENFKNYMIAQDQLSLAFVQVVYHNNTHLLEILLKHGVDAKSCDMFNTNGIMRAACKGHSDMIVYLIKLGVNINHKNKCGITALRLAAEMKRHKCLQVLVQQPSIDIDIKDGRGWSALMRSARVRDWRGMKILIDARKDKNGINALHILVDTEMSAFTYDETARFEHSGECLKLLTNAGIDINAADIYQNTPLLYAILCRNFHAVKLLLKLNCRLTTSQQIGSTFISPYNLLYKDVIGSNSNLFPLYAALHERDMKTVELLWLAGIEVHQLAQEPSIIEYITRVYPALGDLLQKLVYNPVSLQHACRNKIRQCVGSRIAVLRSAKLNLPVFLVRYIWIWIP